MIGMSFLRLSIKTAGGRHRSGPLPAAPAVGREAAAVAVAGLRAAQISARPCSTIRWRSRTIPPWQDRAQLLLDCRFLPLARPSRLQIRMQYVIADDGAGGACNVA